MNLIGREELKAKLDQGDDFKLVMTLGGWAFRAKHIPGFLNISNPDDSVGLLKSDDEIVVYCSGGNCPASIAAYQILQSKGFANVRRYAGGLADWEEAGYPLEEGSISFK